MEPEILCDWAEEVWPVPENSRSKNLKARRGSNVTTEAPTRKPSFAVCLPEGTMPHTAVKASRPFLARPPLSCLSPPPWSSLAPPEEGKQVEGEQAIFLCPPQPPQTDWVEETFITEQSLQFCYPTGLGILHEKD